MADDIANEPVGEGRLTATLAAHELNNIFGAIMGYAQFILEDAPAGGAQSDHARKIVAAVEKGAALAKRLALEANEDR